MRIENEDKRRRTTQRVWFALFGMLLYPLEVVLAAWMGLSGASDIPGDMAPTYFVSVAALVAAYYGKEVCKRQIIVAL